MLRHLQIVKQMHSAGKNAVEYYYKFRRLLATILVFSGESILQSLLTRFHLSNYRRLRPVTGSQVLDPKENHRMVSQAS